MPKIIHALASFQPQALQVGSPTPRSTGKRIKAPLLLGLSGLRSAALPLPLGVFRPSERYWWPLSPSSSLRFACNQKVRELSPVLLVPLLLRLYPTLWLVMPHSRGLTQKANLSHQLPSPAVLASPHLDGQTKWLLSYGLIIYLLTQLGTGLVAKNNSCIMERKFTFMGISQSDLVGYPFLCSSDTVYLYPVLVTYPPLISCKTGSCHLSLHPGAWRRAWVWRFLITFYIHSSNAFFRATWLATGPSSEK